MTRSVARAQLAPASPLGDEILAKFMRGLGDPTRLRILRYLLAGPRSVSEIIDHLHVPQSRVSNHLACLKWCGYVIAERQGRSIRYRIADGRVRVLLRLAHEITGDNAERVASCVRIEQ